MLKLWFDLKFTFIYKAGKGVHSVPPGVAATPVLSTPYIVQNTGVPAIYPMGIPYDLQFQTTRDHNAYPYATQGMNL